MSRSTTDPADTTGTGEEPLKPLYIAATGVVFAVFITGALLVILAPDWQTRGQFGDMYGVLNTTFSGLAFSALVYTLVLQRKELRLQRNELALTRSELSKQASAQQEQANTALRAARISALGSLYQSYSTLVVSQKMTLIGDDPYAELARIQKELKSLLKQTAKNGPIDDE